MRCAQMRWLLLWLCNALHFPCNILFVKSSTTPPNVTNQLDSMKTLPILSSRAFGNHQKRLFLLRGSPRGDWDKTCFTDSSFLCAIGKECTHCGNYNSAFYAVSSAMFLNNSPPALSRKVSQKWFDIMMITPAIVPLSAFLSNTHATKVIRDTYGPFTRRKFYDLAKCTTACVIDPIEILQLASVDFLCQNHDRLNREFRGIIGDDLRHIFINPLSRKLQYIDNACRAQLNYEHILPKATGAFKVDGHLDTRAAFEIVSFYNASTKRRFYHDHIVTVDSFISRVSNALTRVHKISPHFIPNLENRVKVLSGLLLGDAGGKATD